LSSGTEQILGYSVYARGLAGCVSEAMSWIESGTHARWLACLNPHAYAVALHDRLYSEALNAADWLTPDGVGVVLASRCLHGVIQQRVTGSDIFQSVHQELDRRGGCSVFFLGSTPHTLLRIRGRMAVDFPRVRVAGTYSPPIAAAFMAEELDEMVHAVNTCAPEVLWVGMTAPKQEKWIHANHARLNVKFIAAVGAVFDFYTGRVQRSHPLFQRAGLEWLPRLLQEPRRLWRRTFVSAPVFAWHVLRERFGR
jgi:N-acetylglucosaminyldiphosphoundecaprenol N-acetyl-beta-D-mannosaminyltransferase